MLPLLCSFYITVLIQFAFVSHPIIHSFLLLSASVSCAFISYFVSGFSWYVALFCLVYVGGVYTLFIFISVYTPNPNPFTGSSLYSFPFFFFICFFFFYNIDLYSFSPLDCSHILCSSLEGYSYCILCFSLILGFSLISTIVSEKGSFFR